MHPIVSSSTTAKSMAATSFPAPILTPAPGRRHGPGPRIGVGLSPLSRLTPGGREGDGERAARAVRHKNWANGRG